MEQRHRDRIDECCKEIVPKMRKHIHLLWPKLLENRIFTRVDVNIPRWIQSLDKEETVRDIYLTLKTRGPEAFERFLTSLRQCSLEHLAVILEGNQNTCYQYEVPSEHNGNLCPINGTPIVSTNQPVNKDQDGFFQYIQQSEAPLKIEVEKAVEFLDESTETGVLRYPMRSKPRGLVLIITIIKYTYSVEPPRYSAEYDEHNLRLLFEQMGFRVTTYRDLSGQAIMDKVLEFSKREDLRKVDSCFVIISSHGNSFGTEAGLDPRSEDAEIQGTDYVPYASPETYRKVTCADVINCFKVESCPNLGGKPKIFIFQLCRGQKNQKSLSEPRFTMDTSTYIKVKEQSGSLGRNHIPNERIPRDYSDMLVAHSTMPGYVAFRDKVIGSWFIQILCEVFMNHASRMHVQDLFNLVDERLATQRTKLGCQTTAITSLGFNKHCYLNPGFFNDS